jgi:plasmid stabilization system protein ParE
MNVVTLPSATADLADGFAFYEDQGAGLGAYFLESLFSDIDSLQIYAGVHRKFFGYHRLLSNRFPYAIYYSMESGTVSVRAVLDCRRDPKWTRQQLR